MRLEIDDAQVPVRVRLLGDLMGELEETIEKDLMAVVSEPGHQVVVDLSKVNRIDSRWLGILVSLTARSNLRKGRIGFTRPTEFVQGVLEATKLDKFLPLEQ